VATDLGRESYKMAWTEWIRSPRNRVVDGSYRRCHLGSLIVNGQSQIHGNSVPSKGVENWDTYVARSAEETLRYVQSLEIPPEAKQYGEIFFNVIWVDEAEYLGFRRG